MKMKKIVNEEKSKYAVDQMHVKTFATLSFQFRD